jgi:hypothetical protein
MEQREAVTCHVASYAYGTGKLIWEGDLVEGSEDYESLRMGSFLERLPGNQLLAAPHIDHTGASSWLQFQQHPARCRRGENTFDG